MNLRFATLGVVIAAMAVSFLAPASAYAQEAQKGAPATAPASSREAVLQRVSDIVTKQAFVPNVDFTKWEDFLKEYEPKLQAAKSDDEYSVLLNEALRKFGMSHFVVFSPSVTDRQRTRQIVGVGIQTTPVKDGLLIIRTFPGAPAEMAGLQPGDTILEVDGKKVSGTSGIAGDEGTTVRLKIKRREGKEETIAVVRKKFSTVERETVSLPDESTAMIRVPTFDFTYSPERMEELVNRHRNRPNLILDLRDNGGGAVLNLQHLLSLFMPGDTPIGTFINRRAVDRFVESTGGSANDLVAIANATKSKLRVAKNQDFERYTGKIIVLIDRGSGSAAEMAAAALRDEAGAKVVGEKSAGAVLVSVIVPLVSGFSMQYPLSDYITLKGARLEGAGVTPDAITEEPPYRLPGDPDLTVRRALDLLVSMPARTTGGSGNQR